MGIPISRKMVIILKRGLGAPEFVTANFTGLTHWGWDKMSDISQTTFSNAFSRTKIYELQIMFNSSLSLRSNYQYPCTGSDNGLAPTRRQAIIWTNDGLGHRRIYASLGLNELMRHKPWPGMHKLKDILPKFCLHIKVKRINQRYI